MYAPIVTDETPTPKQSGSYGVMRGICEDSVKRLVEWSSPRELHREADIRAAAGAAMAMAQRFSDMLVSVESWATRDPHPDVKRETIDQILALREDAGKLLKRYGATL